MEVKKPEDGLPDNLGDETWYHLKDGTDKGRDERWAPCSGIQNLLDDGWVFSNEDGEALYALGKRGKEEEKE